MPAVIAHVVRVVHGDLREGHARTGGFSDGQADEDRRRGESRAKISDVFRNTIVTNPVIWIVACAYACTGAVRQGIDQWFPRFMQEVYHVDFNSRSFSASAFPDSLGRLAGLAHVRLCFGLAFQGRRAPVAAGLYLIETVIILRRGAVPHA